MANGNRSCSNSQLISFTPGRSNGRRYLTSGVKGSLRSKSTHGRENTIPILVQHVLTSRLSLEKLGSRDVMRCGVAVSRRLPSVYILCMYLQCSTRLNQQIVG
ncbi:hypothetical protein GE21DRAFT_1201395 [Neurospora crassa]|nr:hypothetical protein B14D6.310 [imported] - Neurospora crassa [Neurospora crassa]KHE87628.1 hypothetical protein GE21DRAFT_1201395 [Neurospora crassa]